MKISREWLQTHFEKELPSAEVLGDALTFHAFEIEGIEGDILDVKVTPNRGHDCLSHIGIAKELSAILELPLKEDPLREDISLEPSTDTVLVSIDTPLCNRYIAGYIKDVKVGPSPDWLRKNLESLGQRSINNVVDATNYVMFNLGQPLHAFDAGKLHGIEVKPQYSIAVRVAEKGEKMLALDDKEYQLSDSMMVIADNNSKAAVGIAGVKGGKPAGVGEETKDIIIESANFDGVSVRKTSQALKLRTDASTRFEQVISPELAAYGMRAATDLILQIAGGELVGFTDVYPRQQVLRTVEISAARINAVLGTQLSENHIADALTRLALPFMKKGDAFIVTPPFERIDLVIPEDLIEEVGRIIGYEKISATPLPVVSNKPEINANFLASETIREDLVSKGYSEVFTSVFSDNGERAVLNKVDSVKPYLRASLIPGLQDALTRNIRNKDFLGLKEVKLFEIGTVWKSGKETVMLGTVGEKDKPIEKSVSEYQADKRMEEYINLTPSKVEKYKQFSKYPSMTRDVALWVPKHVNSENVKELIIDSAGDLLVQIQLFDQFEKGDKVSFAFRLVFQSFDRTLTDEDANSRMESVYAALKKEGFEIR
jgi:phenylalanyl-tRNA synthetase beta chain